MILSWVEIELSCNWVELRLQAAYSAWTLPQTCLFFLKTLGIDRAWFASSYYFYGWLGGLVACLKLEIRLYSALVWVEVELSWVEAELGNFTTTLTITDSGNAQKVSLTSSIEVPANKHKDFHIQLCKIFNNLSLNHTITLYSNITKYNKYKYNSTTIFNNIMI